MFCKSQMTNFPFIVVSPQCPDGKLWSNDQLLSLLDDVEKRYAVDSHRVYLTGLSMGGFGAWSLGLSHPDRFAALAPLCGGGDYITPYLLDDSLKPALRMSPRSSNSLTAPNCSSRGTLGSMR